MDSKAGRSRETVVSSMDEYRASVKRLIQTEVGNIIDEEIRNAARELVEEQRTAIREAVEEHKLIIRQVVEEERQALRSRVEDIRRAIVRLGTG